jgi:hypothetical protein
MDSVESGEITDENIRARVTQLNKQDEAWDLFSPSL